MAEIKGPKSSIINCRNVKTTTSKAFAARNNYNFTSLFLGLSRTVRNPVHFGHYIHRSSEPSGPCSCQRSRSFHGSSQPSNVPETLRAFEGNFMQTSERTAHNATPRTRRNLAPLPHRLTRFFAPQSLSFGFDPTLRMSWVSPRAVKLKRVQ